MEEVGLEEMFQKQRSMVLIHMLAVRIRRVMAAKKISKGF